MYTRINSPDTTPYQIGCLKKDRNYLLLYIPTKRPTGSCSVYSDSPRPHGKRLAFIHSLVLLLGRGRILG